MKLIGLTGGVGMGKSTAAGFFLASGARVMDTDDVARQVVAPGQPGLAGIRREFGPEVILPDGSLDRSLLARIVFAKEPLRKKLESILHPLIRETWTAAIESWRKENVALAVVIIPLLYETQTEVAFHRIICVACSAASQNERLAVRGWSPEQIQQRISAQWPVEQKLARSDYVIWTEGSQESHRRQILQILAKV